MRHIKRQPISASKISRQAATVTQGDGTKGRVAQSVDEPVGGESMTVDHREDHCKKIITTVSEYML